jgi:hypothetical protein
MAAKIKRNMTIALMAITLPLWIFPVLCWEFAKDAYYGR